MRKNHFFLFFFAVVALISCRDKNDDNDDTTTQPTKVAVTIKPMWGNEPFNMQQVYYDNFGNRIRADKFMHYISFMKLKDAANNDVVLKDFYLADYYNPIHFEFEVAAGTYRNLSFGVGVPEEYNKDQDPAQYASSHPLSVAGSQGMFWTWNTGYIFLKYEGKVDSTATEGAELLEPVAIHVGDDPMFTRYSTPDLYFEVPEGKTKDITLVLHVDQIFATGGTGDIDLSTDAITHTSNNMQLAEQFMTNFVNAITVE